MRKTQNTEIAIALSRAVDALVSREASLPLVASDFGSTTIACQGGRTERATVQAQLDGASWETSQDFAANLHLESIL